MSTFLNVPTVQYAPFAFLNLINPLVSIFYGFTGITMEKMTEEEYAVVLENRRLDKEAALKAAQA
jgi:NhaC family Na+:H+ antiporter